MKVCTVDGCVNKQHANGMCSTHRRRERLYGNPLVTKNRPPGCGFFALGYKAAQIDGIKKFDHVRIAESALGKPLPAGAVVHHADGSRDNNTNGNLVICPDKAYHNLLHARMSAQKACGDPDKRKCRHCKQYDSVELLRVYPHGATTSYWHTACANEQAKRKYHERKSNAAIS